MSVQPITEDVMDALHALNNIHAEALSLTTPAGFRARIDAAYFSGHIQARGFMIAYDHRAKITGENYDYLASAFDSFVYVDRIAVDARAQGMGYGRELYEALFRRARQDGHKRCLCEINVDPPNPSSVAFHKALGFLTVFEPRDLSNGKTVQYFEMPL